MSLTTLKALYARFDSFIRFCLVGASGIVVNEAVLWLVTSVLGVNYLYSPVFATLVSSAWNFGLTEVWVFRTQSAQSSWRWRVAPFFLLNFAALALREPIYAGLTARLHINYLVSNLISLALLTVVRYLVARGWIWRSGQPRPQPSPKHWYSIHDLLTIASEVALPELEPFRTTASIAPADIVVRIGRVRRPAGAARDPRHVVYDEGLGLLGFQCRIDLGDAVEVTASPLLRLSPHVLYTNVVEPILRWTLAGRGYTLVHGACLAWGQAAYLITALTDTGKTTTVLQLLKHSRPSDQAAFISDDLTLLSPDGRVRTFPKPLTISAHTLHSIDAGQLDFRLRLFLPWQSMIHSRGGRRAAHRMAHFPLPIATINAVTQMLVPPPKYPVQALVPEVKFTASAQLAGIIFIEWGQDADLRLADDEALDRLMRNGDDAYGFPPYAAIAPSLYQSSSGDLRLRERETVAAALQGVPKRLIRREHGNWWRDILEDLSAAPAAVDDVPGVREWSGPQRSSPLA